MTKLYIEENTIEKSILPKIEQAITNLNKSINGVGTLIVPDDFEYAQYLKELADKNYIILQALNEKKKTIEESVKKLKSIEKSNLENYVDIKILNLPSRKSISSKE